MDEIKKGIMQAKTLPEGVCNFPIRMTTAEHDLWGKFTYGLNLRDGTNRSVGDVMRQALAEGAERLDAVLAKQIKEVRAERLRVVKGAVILFVGLLAIGTATELRRSPRGRRVEQEEAA